MTGRAALALWLLLLWVALWGDLTAANVASGVLVVGVVLFVMPAAREQRRRITVRPLRALHFLGHFLRVLVESNVAVAVAVVKPRSRLRSGIVAVPLRWGSDALVTLVAAAVTLTPGTLTVEVGRHPVTLYVHVFDVRDVSEVRRAVLRMEQLAVLAFGPREAVAAVSGRAGTDGRAQP